MLRRWFLNGVQERLHGFVTVRVLIRDAFRGNLEEIHFLLRPRLISQMLIELCQPIVAIRRIRIHADACFGRLDGIVPSF